jgi:uncharacterized protein (UPF0248 family)
VIPIQDLLHRIRWDADFGKAEFVIGYYDRVARRIVRVPYRDILVPKADHFAFSAADADGYVHDVPLHRVREVWRDGILIWHRERPGEFPDGQ